MSGKPPSIRNMHEAIDHVIAQQRAYEEKRPTRLGKGTEWATSLVGPVIGRFVKPEWVRAAVDASDASAGFTLPSMEHDTSDPAACEAAAIRVQGWAQGLNASSGFAAGVWGAAGLAVDVPATLVLAARTVRATGAAYGFSDDSEDERAFRLMVLEVASSGASENRDETLHRINKAAKMLSDPAVRKAVDSSLDWVGAKVVDRIARQLGVSLAGRKAGQVVPVVGGLVGATVNASFQTDVARAARYAYSLRWMMERKLLPAPQDNSKDTV